jgi:nitrilase
MNAAELLPEPGGTGGAAYEMLRGIARGAGIHVHGGSLIEQGPGDEAKLFNTTLVFDPEGREIARYRKIHLFDITGPDGTGYRESALYGAGDSLVTFEAGGIRFGCTICYDMRFPGALPGAAPRRSRGDPRCPPTSPLMTGKDHWEVLLRARPSRASAGSSPPPRTAPTRSAGATRQVYGHSLIADPWGHVIARASDGTGWATARWIRACWSGCGATCPCWTTGGSPEGATSHRLPRRGQRGGAGGPAAAGRPLRRRRPGRGRIRGGARRRRLHAGNPAPLPRPQRAHLRHEPRQRRLPDEHL